MTRGIKNVSGVSCHISCALQILLHSLVPICEALTKKENGPHPSKSLHQLAEFAKQLTESGDEDTLAPVDPSSLYKMLKDFRFSTKSALTLEPEDVGDASTAILMLLKILKQQSKDWASLVDICITGSMRHSIKGECHFEKSDDYSGKRIRIKSGKIKQMPFPFPLSGKYQSLDEALRLELQATEVVGYNWQSQKPESYEETRYDRTGQEVFTDKQQEGDECCDSDGYDSATEWKTEKALHIEALPHYCFFHLDRFSYDSVGDKTLVNPTVEIPLYLERSALQPNEEGCLQLSGGILHVSEGGKIEEEGHYVTILRIGKDSWVLIDDEICSKIPSDEAALELLKGTTNDGGNFVCATLVAFEAVDQKANTSHILNRIQSQTAEDLAGKRLLVKWAKAKFYAGTVKAYDAATGKHSILYDDGDVKQYLMNQKVVEYQ